MIRILRIDRDHPLYEQEVALRREVLLAPIGIDMPQLEAMFPGNEERYEHFVAVIDHPAGERVVGCAVLLPHHPEPGSGKLAQMAVDPQRQREGIGRRIVVEIERRAFGALGLQRLFCHAREDVVPFYAALGWRPEGPGFEEAGIPHVRMAFAPSDPMGDSSGLGGLDAVDLQ